MAENDLKHAPSGTSSQYLLAREIPSRECWGAAAALPTGAAVHGSETTGAGGGTEGVAVGAAEGVAYTPSYCHR